MNATTGRETRLQDAWPAGLFAAANLILHLVSIRGFGFFRDELYYIACSDHLALGYVDQPPLSILLLKLVRLLFGDSPTALRLLPALGGAAFVLLAALIVRELGGRSRAMTLASAAAFAATGSHFMFHVYSMNFLDILFWQAGLLVLLRIVQTGRARLWIVFGLVAGLGLQNKTSVLFLLFGIGVGLLLTRERKWLKSPYLWLGGVLAVLLFLPYIAWNAAHGWPMLEFMRNASQFKNVQNTPLGFLLGQILYNNPLTLFVWLPGLLYFFFHREGRKYRIFGWMYVSLFVLFLLQNGKDYYLAGAYPVLFAGGGIAYERWTAAKRRWFVPAFSAALGAASLVFLPMVLPILPVEKTVSVMRFFGFEHSQENQDIGLLPQHFADMFGWQEMAAEFARIYGTLAPEGKADCWIYVRNYGEAAAIDFYGPARGLPKASCGHNSYWFWGPPDWHGRAAIILGDFRDTERSFEDLKPHFREVVLAGRTSSPYAMPYENGRSIFICRGFRSNLKEVWTREKNFL